MPGYDHKNSPPDRIPPDVKQHHQEDWKSMWGKYPSGTLAFSHSSTEAIMNDALNVTHLALAFGRVERATKHYDGVPETDTTHTVMLTLLAMVLIPKMTVKLNPQLVMAFSQVHDLPEAIAGDVSTLLELSKEDRAAKDQREHKATQEIVQNIPLLGRLIKSYNRMDTAEARFVYYLDKILPRLVGYKGRYQIPCSREELEARVEKQGAKLAELSPDMPELAQLFSDASKLVLTNYDLNHGEE